MSPTNESLMLLYIFGVLFAIAVILLGIFAKIQDKKEKGDNSAK